MWGFSQATVIERAHLSFCKRILGVKQSTQNDFIYGELGRTTLIVKRYFHIIKYWLKICNLCNTKYARLVYDMLVSDTQRYPTKVNWASLVRDLLNDLGFGHAWIGQGVGDVDLFLLLLKQRLNDQFIQNWYARLNASSRASFYINIARFSLKSYLNDINITKFRVAITRFRTSSHRLAIETGRWTRPNKTPRENRLCTVCMILEDEYHFVLECSLYIDLRKQYINKRYWYRVQVY